MTEPNAENAVAAAILTLFIAPASANPVLPTKISDFDTLDAAFVNIGHTAIDKWTIEADQDVQPRYSAALPKNVPFKRDRYAGPLTISTDALEVSRTTIDAAFGGGTFTAQLDGSVKFEPSSAGVKDYVALAHISDDDDAIAYVLTRCNNVNPKMSMQPKQGDLVSMPLQLASVGTAASPWGWYEIIDAPGVVVGS